MSVAISEYELSQFTGTEKYYRHWTMRKSFAYTEGIHYLVKNGAAWLVDVITSHQMNPKLKKGDLREFQLWELKVQNNKGVVTCKSDDGKKPVITQNIEYTDFPLDEITIYVELGSLDGETECLIAMLPSER